MESYDELIKQEEALKKQIFELYKKRDEIKKKLKEYCSHEYKIKFQPSHEYCVEEAEYCNHCGITFFKYK
ncbi:hypothetical protein [Paenibacillus sp. EPM92]|uniref:hypothetical protein n=1 Tax=Paenibacillus sp. EPM92 TaxID=1561195 RepID=UPI001916378C|nr:hypothetical protein [Paenibacillus sp. EPM92]